MENQERYEIRRKLGQGGVGAVYEGYDHQLRRRVAVKRLLDSSEDDPDANSDKAVQTLLKECHSLSALNSPNIVRLFDFGQDADGPFVVMELLEGETLDALIEKAPLTAPDFIKVAEQSMEGLLAAHDAHLLHRDLKPCNFMVTWLPSGRMQIKILDFGLAKFSVEPTKQTIAHGNSLFGSIYFMAPEQFEQHPLDARTDLYALGTVYYYALAGAYPFDGESVAQVMASHLTGRYKDLREYRQDVNPEICKWIMGLISRDPDHRPDSCATALAQFMGIQNGTFTPAEPNTVPPETKPPPEPENPSEEKVTLPSEGLVLSGQSAMVPLNRRPAEHTGAVHVHQKVSAHLNTAPVAVSLPLEVEEDPIVDLPDSETPPEQNPQPPVAEIEPKTEVVIELNIDPEPEPDVANEVHHEQTEPSPATEPQEVEVPSFAPPRKATTLVNLPQISQEKERGNSPLPIIMVGIVLTIAALAFLVWSAMK